MPNSSPYVLTGKDEQTYPIGAQGLTLGRDPTNDIVIDDSQVAARHARILFTADRCFIRDERGSGGTFVNQERVEGQRELFPGDIIQLGSSVFKLASAEPSSLHVTPVATSTPLPASTSQSFQSRRNIVLIVLALVVALSLLLLPIMVVSPIGPSLPTETPTITSSPTQTIPIPEQIPSATDSPPTQTPSPTSTPTYAAKIVCEVLEPKVKSYSCTITNLGNVTDTLWLLFAPYQIENLNDFEIAVIIKDQESSLNPSSDNGLVEIGEIEPKMEKNIEIRLECSLPAIGCRETNVLVSLIANDGFQLVHGQDGEFVLTHVHDKPAPIPTKTLTTKPKTGEKTQEPPVDEGPGG